jgi:hypothetical protein
VGARWRASRRARHRMGLPGARGVSSGKAGPPSSGNSGPGVTRVDIGNAANSDLEQRGASPATRTLLIIRQCRQKQHAARRLRARVRRYGQLH